MLTPNQHIHIIGVGGFGMSAIAHVLLGRGYTVSGSDQRANDLTRAVAAAGGQVFQGHAADHIAGADMVVRSSAVPLDNPEVVAATMANIPVLRRRELLGQLMAGHIGIAVAGTHGKTTTTALLAHVLIEAGLDPTYIIGGVSGNTGTNAGVGRGFYFVIEADEYDHMFLGLRPQIGMILNIEHDHTDCFPTPRDVIHAFTAFAELVPDDGLLVACVDDPVVMILGERRRAAGHPVAYYGFSAHPTGSPPVPTWTAVDTQPDETGGMVFGVLRGADLLGRVRLNQPGRHNVLNALAVLAVTDHLGVPLDRVAAAFDTFQGTGRRSELMGQAGGVTVISDYAHHPTAIRVTLAAHRERPGIRDVWAVWQPHTFTRLRALADDFAGAFAAADHVLVTDVYSVREDITPGLNAMGIAQMITDSGHPDAAHSGDLERSARVLEKRVQPGDLVLLLSAGDAPLIGTRVLELLTAREDSAGR
ncbi:MAG: UDP-N-acetylmuramate--L-alanine ligase [Anaerolineae bacterium]|nr:UDP-N-acetylmuramate--L-alanine ligase [Anaerolineae bacterium]